MKSLKELANKNMKTIKELENEKMKIIIGLDNLTSSAAAWPMAAAQFRIA